MKLEELSRLLRETDPAAVLVDPPTLAKVVENVTGGTWAPWQEVPHSHCFVVDQPTLYSYVDRDELHQLPGHRLPLDAVLLLERPTADQLNGPRKDLVGRYWQLLFHAATHRELNRRLTGLTPVGLRERVDQIGPAAFEEARNVLIQDGLLPHKADDSTAYIEFAATFLELRFFNPTLVPVCFPSLPSAEVVEKVLARDVDGPGLFQQTRLSGATDPTPRTDDQSDESHDFYYRLVRSAQRAAKAGDTVVAAILHTRAARVAPAALTGPTQASARQDIYNLVTRLQMALGLSDAEVSNWQRVLPTLLDKADQGNRPVEAAILHDLQRACLDHEESIYTLDLIEWAGNFGHKPIRRELTSQRFVRVPAQLRLAARRLAAARLSDADRQTLAGLLRDALDRAEAQLRGQFRPTLRDAFLGVASLRPIHLAERAALNKTVEELLDRISSAGFLGFADVRDAVARGQMKFPDLSGPNEYLRGDPLLRLDRHLAIELDGVYRRAETYTRWLERLTAFNFGTEAGRWLTWNVTLPFGAAFLAGEFAWLMTFEQRTRSAHPESVSNPSSPPANTKTEPATIEKPKETELLAAGQPKETESPTAGKRKSSATERPESNSPSTPNPPTDGKATTHAREPLSFFGGWNADPWFHAGWVLLGVLLLVIIRSASVRGGLAAIGQTVYRTTRFLLWDIPTRVWANEWVRRVVGSVPVQLAKNYVGKPLAVTFLFWAADFPKLFFGGSEWGPLTVTFLTCMFLVNFRMWERMEVVLWEIARGLIHLIKSSPAVLRWVNDVFRDLLDILEWVLARTEDWLRIRGSGGPLAVAIRAVAGLVWIPFAVLIRFYTVVLIEPMLNPLKLPLSILFAKFVYPLLIVMGLFEIDPNSWVGFSSTLVEPLARYLYHPIAWLLVIGTLYLLPDAVTFLFWEMRENWRLYRANRPAALKPVAVGPHGETVKGLLHWGFHSGTVPRLYARLRAAEREAARTDIWRDARTYRAALRGVEEAVRQFVARDFIEVLNDPAAGWGGPELRVGGVTLGTNRIRLELIPAGGGATACLEWEDRSGWLVAKWAEAGFLATLPDEQAQLLENALAHLYKRAGVDVVREQVRAALSKEAKDFDIGPGGLLVWYGARESSPLMYDLGDPGNDLQPKTPARRLAPSPVLNARQVVFGRITITWSQWVDVWRTGASGERPRLGAPDYRLNLLPPRIHSASPPKVADRPPDGDPPLTPEGTLSGPA